MSPRTAPYLAALIGAALGVACMALFRMPLFFPGSSIVIAVVLAVLGTLATLAFMPDRWLWSDAERLAQAFQAHHGLSDLGTNNALSAITEAHQRAHQLRSDAAGFHDALKPHVLSVADRLDASAREIFYDPNRLRALRAILTRSELIEDATRAHKALRHKSRGDDTTVAHSRETLKGALQALEDAFAASDLHVAKGHLEQVKIASSVAETLLTPRQSLRQPIQSLNEGDPL